MEYLALYTRIAQPFNPIDVVMSHKLQSRYIHSELKFLGNNDLLLNCFSSRARVRNVVPKKKGVHFANVNMKKGKWEKTPLYRIDTEIKRNWVLLECMRLVGKKYDTFGAFMNNNFQFPFDDKDKYWCSEVGAKVLIKFYPELKTDNVMPATLKKNIERAHYNDCTF